MRAPLKTAIIGYLAAFVIMAALDLLWIGSVMGPLFQAQLSAVVSPDVNLPAAAAFYLIYPVGIMIFAVWPALEDKSWTSAMVRGDLFGFFAYATYDLTNLASLKYWSPFIAMVDVGWGTVVTGTAAAGALLIADRFGRN